MIIDPMTAVFAGIAGITILATIGISICKGCCIAKLLRKECIK